MSEGAVRYRREGAVAHITFDRPHAHNAMTWRMYEQLADACAAVVGDRELRCAVFRGAGGRAFVAGTDIAQFRHFTSAADGLAYEARMEKFLSAVEGLPVPTLAVIDGWAIGGGLAIAGVCDLRIATPDARFGVPIARTLGNCLSIANYARLSAGFGASRLKKMLMLAEPIGAEEALESGFLAEIVNIDMLDARVAAICERLSANAPVTMRTAKEAMRRILHATMPNGDDLVAETYGSHDFQEGVSAFVAKRQPSWEGR
ncbi:MULTISPECIES: enoyl-CoA hydratase/isomerase family protein [unclassified Chelatococcus]|uniref:enoyl-CoA hydratase/isomerase family protein n=1 Tax=unclassified Chelatococcus TaxID=2638111 RepID=UPI001BCAA3A0|nr:MULTISPECIES: enoyl-CoA hydratase/isomerase family protein [unclassified Chelatococcus]MBS7700657.1 enoyl-CoA hydratase/isomerase family protein [Chelatococcus sp. YT9]MBX3559088.1 enoyl-CoA hydratase/isomerase family protein [Chelatococcus sp.]